MQAAARSTRRHEETDTMTTHATATREQWLAARVKLLKEEKELTRRSDELARQRQDLPWVRIDKDYRFDDRRGRCFAGRPVPGTFATPRLPLHVRSRLQGRLPFVLVDRRRIQRHHHPLDAPRRHVFGGVSRAAGEVAGVQAADGLEHSPGRRRPTATSISTSMFPSPKNSNARASNSTTSASRPCAGRRRWSRHPCASDTRRPGAGRSHGGHRCRHLRPRTDGRERIRARRRRHLPHLLRLLARRGRHLVCLSSGWTVHPRAATRRGYWWRRHDEYEKS